MKLKTLQWHGVRQASTGVYNIQINNDNETSNLKISGQHLPGSVLLLLAKNRYCGPVYPKGSRQTGMSEADRVVS